MKKLIYVGLTLIIIGLLGVMLFNQVLIRYLPIDLVAIHHTETVESAGIEQVTIHSNSLSVEISQSPDDIISVDISGETSENVVKLIDFIVNKENDLLKVDVEIGPSFSPVTMTNVKLKVLLPKKLYKNVSVITSSGRIVIQDLQAITAVVKTSSGSVNIQDSLIDEKIKVTTTSGRVKLDETLSKQVIAKSSSGAIEIEKTTGNLDINTSSGRITIDTPGLTGDIIAKTSSGRVSVTIDSPPTSIALDFKSSSGRGDISIPGIQYKEKTRNTIIGKVGTGEKKIHVRTSSGSFELQ